MKKFSLTLLRHGETIAKNCLNGHHNVALSPLGEQQMQQALASIPTVDAVVSSPLNRCSVQAQSYAKANSLPYQVTEQFKEMDFGKWDGKSFDYLYQHYPQQLDLFWQDPWNNPPPSGESVEQFYQRVDLAWHQVIVQEKNTLIVCHGGVIRYIIAKVLGLPLSGNQHLIALKIDYAAVITIDVVIDDKGKIWHTLVWPNTYA
ncbi:histidine phosphatase family protein [Psychrobium sp. 1_MG-2023]|uniref:histidine phosphatase family protein n=1 Tax=Psychrobium sp. 1_MG-2023 TaxID=3062624 RepID=UPI000C31E031|nr:histidine phosphatase family protein [Psychrobium sp. 1_MG-2023]MDP2559714.1 histidine phosphatase family protein [Psychrobium sp. 1_MG-2023]PKF59543.1 histidine phosphatase family protein [Alteromonadales bacterium alter-6D02]